MKKVMLVIVAAAFSTGVFAQANTPAAQPAKAAPQSTEAVKKDAKMAKDKMAAESKPAADAKPVAKKKHHHAHAEAKKADAATK